MPDWHAVTRREGLVRELGLDMSDGLRASYLDLMPAKETRA